MVASDESKITEEYLEKAEAIASKFDNSIITAMAQEDTICAGKFIKPKKHYMNRVQKG